MGTFLFISGQEIFVIMIVILLLFGADKVPEIARGIGKGMRDFRKATDEIRREIETSTRDIRNEMSDIQNTVRDDVNEIQDNVKRNVDETTESIKNDLREVNDEFGKNVDDINQPAGSVSTDYDYAADDHHHNPDDFKPEDQPEKDAYGYSTGEFKKHPDEPAESAS